MKIFILISIVLAVALAAPINDEEVSGPKRNKNSDSYVPPEGSYGPAPASASLYGPVSSNCGHAQAPASSPIAFYLPPGDHTSSALHYRENEHPWKSTMFSEHEEHPLARSYGGYGPAVVAIAGGAAQASALGPVMGLFPNADIEGCAIPLLVSCAPSISKGQIMKSQHASYSSPSYGYRNVDFNRQKQMHEDAMQKAEQQAPWGEMEHAAAATRMGHMHQSTSNVHTSRSSDDLHGNHMHLLSHDAHMNLPTSKIQRHHE